MGSQGQRLARSQPKHAEAIENAIDDLSDSPRPPGCKPLRGFAGVRRIRVGDYRVCYTVDNGKLCVLVVTISTRDDMYQVVKRYLGR
ncbi:type II toxin-antitoxin system RelE/ParE family toxin [Saccharomonospora sp. NPDC046836]|uniref:type II toxin-antitoxin system RelE family toxin n=1 Tax=Saccharomonospora sp. NPDC046836 TaxID=3156921 RepID=UPI003411D169